LNYPTPPIEIDIQVYVRQQGFGGQIQLSETIRLAPTDFAAMAEILSQFHNLALSIQAKRPPAEK
jgi:hypothetical protein